MKLQERREKFSEGDTVSLLITTAQNKKPKRRPAKVLEVLRAACRIQVEGEDRPRTVRFNILEAAPPPPPPPPPKPEPMPTGYTTPRAPADAQDEIGAWLEMGRHLLDPMAERIAQLAEEDEALAGEAKCIAEERKRIQDEIKRTKQRAARLQAALEDG